MAAAKAIQQTISSQMVEKLFYLSDFRIYTQLYIT